MDALNPFSPISPFWDQSKQTLEQEREEIRKVLLTPSREVAFPLEEKEVDRILDQYFQVRAYMEEWSTYPLFGLYEMGEEGLCPEKALALASLVMEKGCSKTPYYTQLIAVLAILSGNRKGRLAQVKTGEGKTMIITLLAFTLVMQKRRVDIVSSSHYLAMRDQKQNAPFFAQFGIITSHICENQKEEINFDAHILYGKATDFEFALMREKIDQRPSRLRFDSVIVDEVDNMLIDTALHSARISYPSLRQSKKLFYPLIYSYLEKEIVPSIGGLKAYLSACQINELPFSEDELETLLKTARLAMESIEGVSYILQNNVDSPTDRKLAIKIIDHENTGQIQEGMRWHLGIHEFLEVKHGVHQSKETITPLSMSHAVYYDLYRNIFGFSGTLGSMFEREHIQHTYQLDLFDLPPYRPSLRHDFPVKTFGSLPPLRAHLIKTVEEMQKKNRPVLVLCSSINETRELSDLLSRSQIPHQLYNEMQEEEGEVVIGKGGGPGVITLATNNGGRGTDIPLTNESLRSGGLHVIFTDYPSSERVEAQGIGRAGRQGQVGSSEILAVTNYSPQELSQKRLDKERLHADLLTRRARGDREVQHFVDLFWNQLNAGQKKERSRSLSFSEEEGLLKREKEIYQNWSENFLEPAELLVEQFQANKIDLSFFQKALNELYTPHSVTT